MLSAATSAGIVLGLAAATAQSLSYLLARQFVVRRAAGMAAGLKLVALAHPVMGAVSLAVLPLLWSPQTPPVSHYLRPLLAGAAFYVVAQAAFFYVLARADASTASPLLGLKILVLAVVTTLFFRQHLAALQWAAVGLSVAGALVLNYSGRAIPWDAAAGVVVACVGFSLSDLNIQWLVESLAPLSKAHAAPLAVCLTYTLLGLASLVLLPLLGSRSPRDWRDAVPYALVWLLSMGLLFACFGYLGAVFGNVVQSSRGVISVVLGAYLARQGMGHLESRVSRVVLLRRVGAAVLMCLAIALYVRGRG